MIINNSYSFVNKQNNQTIISNIFNTDNNEGKICAYDATNPQTSIGELTYNIYNGTNIYLATVHVNKGYKKCGIGSALVCALEQFAASYNIQKIEGYMNNMEFSDELKQENIARTEFYKSLNFSITQQTAQIFTFEKTREKFLSNKNGTNINLTPINTNTKK